MRALSAQQLEQAKAKIEAVFRTVDAEHAEFKHLFDLLTMNLEVVQDRRLAIELLTQNEARTEKIYKELLQELEPVPMLRLPAPLLLVAAETARSPTSSVEENKTASSVSDDSCNGRAVASAPTTPQPTFLPAFVQASQPIPMVKKMFDQAIKALKIQDDPTLAIACMEKATQHINDNKHSTAIFAHAFLSDCFLIKMTAHAKFQPRLLRGGIFTKYIVKDGHKHFVVLDILQDMESAISHINQALLAANKMAKPYSDEIEEILLGLNIVEENLTKKIVRIKHFFENKQKEHEEVKHAKIADGSWFNRKPKISFAAEFFNMAIKPNLARVEEMQTNIREQTTQLEHCLQKQVAVAANITI